MHKKIILPLLNDKKDEPAFFYNSDKLETITYELEDFLSDSHMNNLSFVKKYMGCQEIKSNNSVEGYNDDVKTIMNVIRHKDTDKTINNLYQGYKIILENPEINKENLRKLYDILSYGLLSDEDIQNMGKYYRKAPVYIFYSKRLTTPPDEGVSYKLVEPCMDSLFEYLNNDNACSQTEYFIKSQIAHFYFVYVHPFFDVNGRTSRTLGMWYLLNNKTYPYIIFNRAIPLAIEKYYKVIRDTSKFRNMTFFLGYMLENVKIELEKEHIITSIIENIHGNISEVDYQTLLYILSMKGEKTGKDYASFYNRLCERKKVTTIRDEMLIPLIDRKILIPSRETNSYFNDGKPNFAFEINQNLIDKQKIKRLKI